MLESSGSHPSSGSVPVSVPQSVSPLQEYISNRQEEDDTISLATGSQENSFLESEEQSGGGVNPANPSDGDHGKTEHGEALIPPSSMEGMRSRVNSY